MGVLLGNQLSKLGRQRQQIRLIFAASEGSLHFVPLLEEFDRLFGVVLGKLVPIGQNGFQPKYERRILEGG